MMAAGTAEKYPLENPGLGVTALKKAFQACSARQYIVVCKLVLRYPCILTRIDDGMSPDMVPLLPVFALETRPWGSKDTFVASCNWVSTKQIMQQVQ